MERSGHSETETRSTTESRQQGKAQHVNTTALKQFLQVLSTNEDINARILFHKPLFIDAESHVQRPVVRLNPENVPTKQSRCMKLCV